MTRVCLADAFVIMRLQVATSFRWEGNTFVGNGYTYFEGTEKSLTPLQKRQKCIHVCCCQKCTRKLSTWSLVNWPSNNPITVAKTSSSCSSSVAMSQNMCNLYRLRLISTLTTCRIVLFEA